MNKIILFITIVVLIAGCKSEQPTTANISEITWGESEGKVVKLVTLTNKNGMEARVTNYGAALTFLTVPDKNGIPQNVVIGFDNLKKYIGRTAYGKTIGRFANRIGGAKFTLDGATYYLTANNGVNTIHGGVKGFSTQVFEIDTTYAGADSAVLSMHYTSPDMEEGFPGNLTLYLNYVLTGDNELKLEYKAETDRPTVVNFTNHSYFNLTGTGDTISGHLLRIFADSITPIGPDRLPTGTVETIEGTIYDFRQSRHVREKLDAAVRGYDNNFKLSKEGHELTLAAEVIEPETGIVLEAYTTEPGMQLFTTYTSICLEMQHFPDSPNHLNFPSVVLNPGEVYRQLTIYKFSVLNS